MLKITRSLDLALKAFKADYNKVVKDDDNRANEIVMNLSNKLNNNKSKNLMHISNIRAIKKSIFLNPNAKKVFNYLKQAFIKALILQYFDLECYIQIKTNITRYAISKVLSQFNLNFDALPNYSI